MSYSLHIERSSPISLEEWLGDASKITTLRLQTGLVDSTRTTRDRSAPATGDLEMIGPSGRWEPAFHFSEGRGSFSARGSNALLREAATNLASALGASIIGDDGERYSW